MQKTWIKGNTDRIFQLEEILLQTETSNVGYDKELDQAGWFNNLKFVFIQGRSKHIKEK